MIQLQEMSTPESTLQCIDVVKKRPRVPTVKSLEAIAINPNHLKSKKSGKESRNKLYEIEIVEDGACVKVHYSGYTDKYEWKLNFIQYDYITPDKILK